MKKIILTFLFLVLSNSLLAADPDKIYTVGVVPQQSASKLAKSWGPLLKYVSDQIGIKLRFATAPNIPEFEKRLANGEYDFSYMNPYHYTVFSAKPGYKALMNAQDKRIKGILVVRKDSNINSLEELDGQKLAFPSPAAFAASILTRGEFSQRNIAITPVYVSSHDSTYLSVVKGLYPAGGGVVRTLNALSPEIKEQLRILWTTPGYTPHAIAAHPDMDADIAEKFTLSMIDLNNSEAGKKLLVPLKIKGWQKASDSDWDDVRKLNINLLDDMLE